MHTMWKGSISFGLVNIPIKLHAATEDKDIKFRSLHNKCNTPIKYEKICPVCEEEVKVDDIVKGYELTKGKYVVIEQDELKALEGEKGEKAVEIIDFIQLNEIDPIYFNRSYYMSPDGGAKAYGLLRKALMETGKAGLAKIIIRSKEQLAVIRVYEKTLLMETIHYPDEVRNVAEVPNVPNEDGVSKKEIDTAVLLIDQLTTPFEPEKYEDEYRNRVMELIQSKQKGEKTVTAKTEKPTENITDLMAALQASIDKSKPEKKTTKRKKTTKKIAESK
ncbi:Ku protein [Lederbergia galactosidilytica]|uniref:Non-homologous end joining protein Ku n=1 Tax=Lederbergia galactosidilytica TaxID=217031 RepID=A0A177ZY66_9BACI|nr:Ku protein [Lederbergia galactosidilytica]KRG12520.1 DNA repair protein [Virgibacillus soli]OAK72260.1 DNA repair protein [Lederbergia galactosidilytica]